MRRAAKIDDNQRAIVYALRQCGATVQVLSAVGQGCPDLLVGHHRRNLLLECKGSKGKLTPEQVLWHKGWSGQVAVVRSVDEAIAAINPGVR